MELFIALWENEIIAGEAIDTDFLITFSIRRGKKAYITASR